MFQLHCMEAIQNTQLPPMISFVMNVKNIPNLMKNKIIEKIIDNKTDTKVQNETINNTICVEFFFSNLFYTNFFIRISSQKNCFVIVNAFNGCQL